MIPKRREHWEAEDLLEVLSAFWEPYDFSKDLGPQAWGVLSYVVVRNSTAPVSIKELSQVLHMRWGKVREILLALADSKFITMTAAKNRITIRINEPRWLPEADKSLDP